MLSYRLSPIAANPLGTARVLTDGQSTINIYFFTNNIYSRNRNKKRCVHAVGGTEKENE